LTLANDAQTTTGRRRTRTGREVRIIALAVI
jgi:hypothetical protein